MSERASWTALQTRWAAGDELSPDEERRRVAGSEGDPLVKRELELFEELSAGLRERSAEAPNVALAGHPRPAGRPGRRLCGPVDPPVGRIPGRRRGATRQRRGLIDRGRQQNAPILFQRRRCAAHGCLTPGRQTVSLRALER
jgi:hypothetical protein